MYILLISIVLGLFAALLFVNIYFRWRVVKIYQNLVENEIEFNAEHIFNKKKLSEEILPKYPEHADQIKIFVNYLQFSAKMAAALIFLITAFGGILMYYSKHES